MITITELWLPILLSAVFVFIASSIFHMVIPLHKGDYKKLSGEDCCALPVDALRQRAAQTAAGRRTAGTDRDGRRLTGSPRRPASSPSPRARASLAARSTGGHADP